MGWGSLCCGPGCPPGLRASLESLSGSCGDLFGVLSVVDALANDHDCQVWLVRTGDGRLGVLKSYQRSMMDPARKLQAELEIELHRRLAAACADVVPFWAALDDATHTHILIEWAARGDLRRAIELGAFASERRLRDGLVRPVLRALVALSEARVVHRDVKPENLFVSEAGAGAEDEDEEEQGQRVAERRGAGEGAAGRPKPAGCRGGRRRARGSGSAAASPSSCSDDDCGGGQAGCITAGRGAGAAAGGSSTCSSSSGSSSGGLLGRGGRSGSCASLAAADAAGAPRAHAAGTAAYTAPEVLMAALTGAPVADVTQPKNDVFALGIVALECLTGRHPFVSPGASAGSIVCAVVSGEPVPLPPVVNGSAGAGGGSGGACGGFGGRAAVSEACADWLRACLQKDPALRPSAEDLMRHRWMAEDLPEELEEAEGAEAAAGAWPAPSHCQQQQGQRARPGAGSPRGEPLGCGGGGGPEADSTDWALCGACGAGPARGRLSPHHSAPHCCACGGGGPGGGWGGADGFPLGDGFPAGGGSALLRRSQALRPGGGGGGGGIHSLGAGPGALRSASARWAGELSPRSAGSLGECWEY